MSTEVSNKQYEPFDWALYGLLVKNARKKAGYDTAEQFAKTIYRRTRIHASRDTIYKIEQARQEPTVFQFLAINMALFGNPLPAEIEQCYENEQLVLMQGGGTPELWKVQNYEDACKETGRCSNITQAMHDGIDLPSPFIVALEVHDQADLFSTTPF